MVTQDHPLAGIWSKIERANETINNLNSEINALINGDDYKIVSKLNDDATECIVSAFGPDPPLRLSVLVGEIVHQFRSSLDHLIWALVIENKNNPTHFHQYPICDTPEKFEYAIEKGNLEGISGSAKKIVESRQPYKKTKNIEKNFLYTLRELNNIDKHRLLIIFTTSMAKAQKLGIGSNTPKKGEKRNNVEITHIIYPNGIKRPTENGTEILRFRFAKPEPYFKSEGKPIFRVVFKDLGAMSEQPVIYIISQTRDRVVDLIRSFESEFL